LRVVSVMAVDEPYAADLTAFGDALVHSAWLASWAPEYNIATTASHVVVKGPHVAPGTSYTQAAMDEYINTAVQAAVPAPNIDGKTVFVLYLPPGTVFDNHGTPDTGCALVPYHIGYGALGDGMAVLNRCNSGFTSQLEMFEVVAGHEIAEAATDSNPIANPAWQLYVEQGQTAPQASVWNQEEIASSIENGDECIGTRITETGVEYQRIFSNVAAAHGGDPCVPALAVPFFNVSPDPATNGWIQVTAGQPLDVPLNAWSTAPTADWIATADPFDLHNARFTAHVVSATTTQIGGVTYRTTNNAKPLTLHVQIPTSAASGWWGVVKIWSWHTDAIGAPLPGEDIAHEGLVGLFVP
jgi:hypothetical protein